jgi:hypothetical protein
MMMAEKGGIKGKPIKVGTRPKAAKDANEKELARIMKDTFATPNEVEFYGKMLAEKLGRPTTPEEGLLATWNAWYHSPTTPPPAGACFSE